MSCLTGAVDALSVDPALRAVLRQMACDIAVISPGGGGEVEEIRFSLALVSKSSTALLPANAVVHSAVLHVGTAYTAGTLISIGTPISVAAMMQTGENNPQVGNTLYEVVQDQLFAGGVPVRATFSGVVPIVGDAFVVVRFAVPEA